MGSKLNNNPMCNNQQDWLYCLKVTYPEVMYPEGSSLSYCLKVPNRLQMFCGKI